MSTEAPHPIDQSLWEIWHAQMIVAGETCSISTPITQANRKPAKARDLLVATEASLQNIQPAAKSLNHLADKLQSLRHLLKQELASEQLASST